MPRPRRRTPGTKFAGGHRIRVTPVPIPNTEVKPDTADGTAWETVWESRSLPALSRKARELRLAGFVLYGQPGERAQFPRTPKSGRSFATPYRPRRPLAELGRVLQH